MKRPLVLFSFCTVLLLTLFAVPNAVHALSAWTNVNTLQFGDSNNSYIPSVKSYAGSLYAGTYNSTTGAEVWEYNASTWSQVNTDGFGDVNCESASTMFEFNNLLYVGVNNTTTGVEVWAYDTSSWTQANTDGFYNAATSYIYDFEEYNGSLYAALRNTNNGAYVFRYGTGTNWGNVTHAIHAFGDANNTYTKSLKTYNGNLYAATSNTTTGTEVWRYNGSSWTQVNTDGFGDAGNGYAELEVFGNDLYAATWSLTGVEVWKYDGSIWTQVNTDGFGNSSYINPTNLVEFNGNLYVGTNPANLFEYDGSGWTSVTAPPLANGTPSVYEVWNGKLYTGSGAGYVEVSNAEADLIMDISADYEEVNSFNITYTITIANNGPDSASNIVFTATIPDGTTYTSAAGTGWICGAMGQVVQCTRSTLSSDTATVITLIVHAEDEGDYELTASVSSDADDNNQDDNSDTLFLDVTYLAETGTNILIPMMFGGVLVIFPLLKRLHLTKQVR